MHCQLPIANCQFGLICHLQNWQSAIGNRKSLDDRASPIDDDNLASNVVCRVRSQKHSDAFQFTFITDARNRVSCFDGRLGKRQRWIGKSRMKETWSDRVDANALPAPRSSEFSCESKQ